MYVTVFVRILLTVIRSMLNKTSHWRKTRQLYVRAARKLCVCLPLRPVIFLLLLIKSFSRLRVVKHECMGESDWRVCSNCMEDIFIIQTRLKSFDVRFNLAQFRIRYAYIRAWVNDVRAYVCTCSYISDSTYHITTCSSVWYVTV